MPCSVFLNTNGGRSPVDRARSTGLRPYLGLIWTLRLTEKRSLCIVPFGSGRFAYGPIRGRSVPVSIRVSLDSDCLRVISNGFFYSSLMAVGFSSLGDRPNKLLLVAKPLIKCLFTPHFVMISTSCLDRFPDFAHVFTVRSRGEVVVNVNRPREMDGGQVVILFSQGIDSVGVPFIGITFVCFDDRFGVISRSTTKEDTYQEESNA